MLAKSKKIRHNESMIKYTILALASLTLFLVSLELFVYTKKIEKRNKINILSEKLEDNDSKRGTI